MRNVLLTGNQQNKLGLYFPPDIFDNTTTSSTTPTQPKITTLPSGQVMVNSGQTTFDKVLATILAGAAIIKNRPYIPTTMHPETQNAGGYSPEMLAYLQAQALQQQNSGGNFGAQAQSFIENNSTAFLIGGAILVAFMMKPPTRR